MLTVKDINEVSFGKAGFNGYKPEDVDNFIDEVVESFTQLLAERDDALQQSAQAGQQVQQLNSQIGELNAKNAELQKKLGILAQKIESYREDENSVMQVLLNAQKSADSTIQSAKDKSAVILADAEDSAKKLLENARNDAAKAAREYADQVEQKKTELEEIKRQVSAFRVSLLEMYKKHLEIINHIPSFRFKDTPSETAAPSQSQPESKPSADPDPVPTPVPVQKEEPKPVPQPEPVPEPQPAQQAEPRRQTVARPAPAKRTVEAPAKQAPTLHDRVDYSREQTQREPDRGYRPDDDDLSQVGIDLKAYSDIPETLQREKASHFSNLEFGDNVDLSNKKRKR
ncbi:MAG: DivIVA domain-containing protein [Acutalibacter sp.]|jgi:cell division initiation protein